MSCLPPYPFQQLQDMLQWQYQKLQELEYKVKQLENDMEKLSKQRPMTVEKIEYKFDQLKIEKLEGTLHIGVSPGGDKTIEDLSVDGDPVETITYNKDLYQCVNRRIEEYLSDECPAYIRSMEEKYQMIIGNDYRNTMIKDIRGQVDKRIENYIQSMPIGDGTREDPNQKEQAIFEKLKSDIEIAIDRHIQKQKRRE